MGRFCLKDDGKGAGYESLVRGCGRGEKGPSPNCEANSEVMAPNWLSSFCLDTLFNFIKKKPFVFRWANEIFGCQIISM